MFAVGDTDCVPPVALLPLHPPDAVHDVALVELQLIVEDCPEVMEAGEAEIETTGVGMVGEPETFTVTILV